MWVSDIWNSFKTGKEGLSGRKMAAFWAITIVATILSFGLAYAVIKRIENPPFLYLLYLVFAWLTFGGVCLGLVTIPELIKFLAELKNGKSINESTTNTTTTTEQTDTTVV